MQELPKTKIIFLILSSDKYPSPINEKKQNKTWVQYAKNSGNKVIFYKGGTDELLDEDYLYVNSGDGLYDIGYKTIDALKWVKKNYDFEYVVRSNSSTYINVKEIEKFIESLDLNTPIYAGRSTSFNNQFNYVHGSCIILNSLAVMNIIENEEHWDHRLIDDAALGKLFDLNKIKVLNKDIFHVGSELLRKEFNKNQIAYRCKMELAGYPRYLDKFFIQLVHDFLSNKNSSLKVFFYRVVFNVIKIFNFKYYYLRYIPRIYYKLLSFLPNKFKKYIKKLITNLKF